MTRRLLVILVVLGALLVGADRVAAFAAGQIAAGRVADQLDGTGDPDVDFRGFPFLTQLLDRQADRVDVQLRDAQVGDVRVARVSAELRDVRLLAGDQLQVGQLEGEGMVTYPALATAARDVAEVSFGGEDLVRVSRSIGGLSVSALGRASIRGGALVVRPVRIETGSGTVGGRLPLSSFAIRIPVEDLPEGVDVDLQPRSDGIEMRFTGTDVVFAPSS